MYKTDWQNQVDEFKVSVIISKYFMTTTTDNERMIKDIEKKKTKESFHSTQSDRQKQLILMNIMKYFDSWHFALDSFNILNLLGLNYI